MMMTMMRVVMMIIIVMIRDGKGVVWQQSLPEMVQDTADHPPLSFFVVIFKVLIITIKVLITILITTTTVHIKVLILLTKCASGHAEGGNGRDCERARIHIVGQKFQTRRDDVLVLDII